MKKMRKIAALLLAMIMVLAMGMTAFATENTEEVNSNTCKITIVSPSSATAVYKAYKIFDVAETKVGIGENAKTVASYTRPATAKKLPDVPATLFEVVDNGGAVYYNPVSENIPASELQEFLAKVATEEYALDYAEGNTEITGLEPGYYYVECSDGQTAMLRAVAGTNTEITAKDTNSGWGNGGKKAGHFEMQDADDDPSTPDVSVFVEDSFFAIGETVDYEVTYESAQNFTKVTETTTDTETGAETTATETTKVYRYVVTDTMNSALTLKKDSVEVTIKEKGQDAKSVKLTKVDGKENDYTGTITVGTGDAAKSVTITGTLNNNGFNLVIPWAESDDAANVEDFYFKNVPAEIKITYSATVTSSATAGTAMANTARINPNEVEDNTQDKTINVYTGSIDVLKYDGSDLGPNATEAEKAAAEANTLANAVFVISKVEKELNTTTNEEEDVTYYLVKSTDGNISWDKDESKATELTTGTDGKFVGGPLKGLDKGTYALIEKAAPAGYNLLAAPVPFEIAKDGASTEQALVLSEKVANSTGAVLPSTGGIGTTIFYVVGGILVLGAAVLLITKKRMSASK